jgi:hypothetical protein
MGPSLGQTDIRNAGGTWVDQEVAIRPGLVTCGCLTIFELFKQENDRGVLRRVYTRKARRLMNYSSIGRKSSHWAEAPVFSVRNGSAALCVRRSSAFVGCRPDAFFPFFRKGASLPPWKRS